MQIPVPVTADGPSIDSPVRPCGPDRFRLRNSVPNEDCRQAMLKSLRATVRPLSVPIHGGTDGVRRRKDSSELSLTC